jgi:hypothetical protein
MPATPVFDAANEDFDYYGWTDNITFLKNSLFGNKTAASSAISQRNIQENAEINSDNKKSSTTTAIESQNRRKFPTRIALTSSDTFFDKYSETLTCDLKFNSLRSGPFGKTDPLISKLFAIYMPQSEEEIITSAEATNLSAIDEPLFEDDFIYSNDTPGKFEDFFAQDNSKHLVTLKVQVPGEIHGLLNASMTERSIEIENEMFWDMPYNGTYTPKSMSISAALNATLIRPENRKHKRSPLLDNHSPIYEFPGSYHKSRSINQEIA